MIDEKALKQYVLEQWRVVVQRDGESYLVTDGKGLYRVGLDSVVFDNRRAFPKLPDDGETLIYYGDGKRVEKLRNGLKQVPESKPLDLRQFIDLPEDAEIFEYEPTGIYLEGDPEMVVMRGHKRFLLAARDQVAMFGNATFLSVSDTSPIIVKNEIQIIGCTMPMDPNHKENRAALDLIREMGAIVEGAS